MMIQGKFLFKALEETAETNELRLSPVLIAAISSTNSRIILPQQKIVKHNKMKKILIVTTVLVASVIVAHAELPSPQSLSGSVLLNGMTSKIQVNYRGLPSQESIVLGSDNYTLIDESGDGSSFGGVLKVPNGPAPIDRNITIQKQDAVGLKTIQTSQFLQQLDNASEADCSNANDNALIILSDKYTGKVYGNGAILSKTRVLQQITRQLGKLRALTLS